MTQATTPRRGGHPLERVLGLGLLSLLLVLCLVLAYLGLFIAMYSDGCTGSDDCNERLINTGALVASAGQALPAVVACAWMARRWLTGRLVWFVPLVLAPLPLIILAAGAWLASLGLD